jgi:hypothetical protein
MSTPNDPTQVLRHAGSGWRLDQWVQSCTPNASLTCDCLQHPRNACVGVAEARHQSRDVAGRRIAEAEFALTVSPKHPHAARNCQDDAAIAACRNARDPASQAADKNKKSCASFEGPYQS